MKRCELCKSPARLYCHSDRASLCWTCDSKVHGANFLVARHSRNLLCPVCHSPTPWSASGAKLCPSVSVCVKCVPAGGGDEEIEVYSDEEDEEVDEGDYDEEDGDNQVVPRSSTTMSTPAPPATSSSSSSSSSSDEESCNGDGCQYRSMPPFMKRARETFRDSPSHWSCRGENRGTAAGEATEKATVHGDETIAVNGRSSKCSRRDEDLVT